jgi:DNA polymerase delta subunit 4
MAPKKTASAPKMAQSPLKQSTLAFRSTKRGAALPSKAKAKAKGEVPVKTSQSETESDGESEPILVEDSGSENDIPVKKEELDVQDKAGNYSKYYREVRQKMGWIPPSESPLVRLSFHIIERGIIAVHAEGQTKIHHMLRVFDNTYEYGPCVGVTRMERWERAAAVGLNPPVEVRHPHFYLLFLPCNKL